MRIGEQSARLPKTTAAMAYAQDRHRGQLRKADRAPFIEHPLEVARLLYRAGGSDEVIAAGLLHDTIEKTGADAGELRARFGNRVANLVLALSEDPTIPTYARRKAALRDQVDAAGHDALMVFAADKVSKVRELGLGASYSQRRLSDSPLVAQLRIELDRVAAPAFA